MKFFKVFIICLIAFQFSSNAQNNVSNIIGDYNAKFPIEKIYLSMDKPYYAIGDTLWFKVFLLNAKNTLASSSDKAYIELYNDSTKLQYTRVIPLKNGLGIGDFALEKNLTQGSYTIRAYTNWQQNFANEYFFIKKIQIGEANPLTWLANAEQANTIEGNNYLINFNVALSKLNNQPESFRDLEASLVDGKTIIKKVNITTNEKGTFTTSFSVPVNSLSAIASLVIKEKNNLNRTTKIPVLQPDTNQIDLQFFPEGGNLVYGIANTLAFKAIGKDGLSKDIAGKIVDDQGIEEAAFASIHNGMGSLLFLPKVGEKYFAVYEQAGMKYKQPITNPKNEGTTLRISHLNTPDSLLIYIKSNNLSKSPANYELIAQASENVILGLKIDLSAGFYNLKLPKSIFPDGIIHFTLIDESKNPLNERTAIINLKKNIHFNIHTLQSKIQSDSTKLEITATDELGKPIIGSFSIAITQDDYVKNSEEQENILSYFLLSGGVKGNIENPGWYFKDQQKTTLAALDNLLLAQAWVGYNWKEVFAKKEPQFDYEFGNNLSGTLKNFANKPIENKNVSLISFGTYPVFSQDITNKNGEFLFADLPVVDTATYMVKVKNQNGKATAGAVKIKEFTAPTMIPFISNINNQFNFANNKVWENYLKSESLRNLDTIVNMKGVVGIKGVTITSDRISKINDEAMINIAWDAEFNKEITEEQLQKKRGKTLWDVLRTEFQGLSISGTWTDNCSVGPSSGKCQWLVKDSHRIQYVYFDKILATPPRGIDEDMKPKVLLCDPETRASNVYMIMDLFYNIKAEDIKNVILYKGCATYHLEITTRSGKGPFQSPTYGASVYKPLPMYFGKEFYIPKYLTAENRSSTVNKATIFWDANIVTDENGKATLWFYSDPFTKYTLKIEGVDTESRLGYKLEPLKTTIQTGSK